MAKAKVAIPKKIPVVDVVLEVRDSRLPVTSAQFELDELIRLGSGRQRLVVLNKADLVPKTEYKKSVSLLELEGTPVITTSAINNSNIKDVLDFITENVDVKFKSLGITVMVVGLPNTGKSTLLNALRSVCTNPSLDKAPAKASGIPGSTTDIGRIQINNHHPKIYVLDTPGVMVTSTGGCDPEMMMKIAAIGSMPNTLVGFDKLADYILFTLNKKQLFQYVNKFKLVGPTNDSTEVIMAVGKSIADGSSRIDYHGAAAKFVSMFRQGLLGKICLDELPKPDQINEYIEKKKRYEFETEPPGPWGPEMYPNPLRGVMRAIYKAP